MALAQVVVEAGYKLCGVRYNPEACRAEHFVADTLEAFMPAVGSKYIQSLTMPAFGQIIKGSDRWMVVGTPCQIAALRRYLLRTRQEERFLLVDFWCHGVPSDRLWKAFLRTVSLTPEQDGIVVSWREKTWGWQDGYVLCVRQGNRVVHHKSASQGDTYLRHFLRCTAQNQTCYGCPFRGISSAADIRVGDFWGTRFKNNRTGVSKVIALSERGRQWWTRAQQYCHIEPLTDEELSQSVVQYDIPVAWGRSTFIRLLPLPGGFRLAHAWSLIGCVLARIQKLIKRGK